MSKAVEIRVPDIGDFKDVEVIEVLVGKGDQVAVESPLLSLESDKASMDLPSPGAGEIVDVFVEVGQRISAGDRIFSLKTTEGEAAAPPPAASASPPKEAPAAPARAPSPPAAPPAEERPAPAAPSAPGSSPTAAPDTAAVHASPSVRAFARELGVDLSRISGTGPKGRILREDVQQDVKKRLSAPVMSGPGAGAGVSRVELPDFSAFGETEEMQLSRIGRLSAAHLSRVWPSVPQVTHHDEADITELEAFRKSQAAEAKKRGVRLTMLAFLMKALALVLREFPRFRASLHPDGDRLIVKRYCHLGIAVDTPDGLIVPVFRDVDRKGAWQLAQELAEVSARARTNKLKSSEIQGACMSISNLGGFGGTAFTPIVNAPEAAILGVTRSRMAPVWNGSNFAPRLMLPLDLSYDHGIIDGATAARFMTRLCQVLADSRHFLL